ncbi:MAG: PepSY domain-containing protein [Bryobacteraceae bacterium]|nr:PepSY domain-containing protein [Bryobacteraceae bacterium]
MAALIRRLHICAGLVVFAQFLVYGIAGIAASVQPSLERPKVPREVRSIPFQREAGESDKAVAARVYELLKPELSRPVPDWFLRKNSEGNLLLDFYNINGIYRTVVEPRQLRVELIRNSAALFLEDIHAANLGGDPGPGLVRVWAAWNEAGIWALLFFCVSGAYLWLATRPGWKWAWVSLAASSLIFGAFWVVFQ